MKLTIEQAHAHLAETPLPPSPWLSVVGDEIHLHCGFTDTLERLLRWIPQARWRRDLRCWSVPIVGVHLVRSILPEISRLAEATLESPLAAESTAHDARTRFRDAARLLFGSDWQRDTARALQRSEPALACWLAGEEVAEAQERVLLHEMQALMRRRARDIAAAAEQLGTQPA